MPKYYKVELTKKQMELISWALGAAIEQHHKFLGGVQLEELEDTSRFHECLMDFTEAHNTFNASAAHAVGGAQ